MSSRALKKLLKGRNQNEEGGIVLRGALGAAIAATEEEVGEGGEHSEEEVDDVERSGKPVRNAFELDEYGDAAAAADEAKKKKKKKKKKAKEKNNVNPFDLLAKAEEGGGEEEEEDKDGEGEEKDGTSVAYSSNVAQATKKKGKKKKKGASHSDLTSSHTGHDNSKNASKTVDDDLEDIDRAIKEVNEKFGYINTVRDEDSGSTSNNQQQGIDNVRALFSVEKKYLSAELEMKRIFGSRIVASERGSASSSGAAGGLGGGRNQRGHMNNKKRFMKKTYLMQFKPTWPKYTNHGLSMSIKNSRSSGGGEFVIEHSKDYQAIERKFRGAVNSLDPRLIGSVLNMYPYHIDCLLQLSDVFKMHGDTQMSIEMIERALYCYEMSFHISFNPALGTCTMDYKCFENRGLFISLIKYSMILAQKGCWRTALEFCKLVLGLDPERDPMGALLCIDFFALQSNQQDYLLRLFFEWEKVRKLSLLPNFAFSIPLAMFTRNDSTSSRIIESGSSNARRKPGHGVPDLTDADIDSYLQRALMQFPMMVVPLMEKCNINISSKLSSHPYFSEVTYAFGTANSAYESINRVCKLYIERSHSVWKEPNVIAWLERNLEEVMDKMGNSSNPAYEETQKEVAKCDRVRKNVFVSTPSNIFRHIVVSDYSSVVGSLPSELRDSGSLNAYDPIPPKEGYSVYDRTPMGTTESTMDASIVETFLRSLLPSFDMRANPEEGMQQPNNNNGVFGQGPILERVREVLEDTDLNPAGLAERLRNLVANPHRALADGEENSEDEDIEEIQMP
eukprot:Nk52_evm5s470 gene=Nk52_evmTU5s470